MCVGIVAYCLLPDFPSSGPKTWLSEQEQRFAEWRITQSANGKADEVGNMREGVIACLTDIKV